MNLHSIMEVHNRRYRSTWANLDINLTGNKIKNDITKAIDKENLIGNKIKNDITKAIDKKNLITNQPTMESTKTKLPATTQETISSEDILEESAWLRSEEGMLATIKTETETGTETGIETGTETEIETGTETETEIETVTETETETKTETDSIIAIFEEDNINKSTLEIKNINNNIPDLDIVSQT